MARKGRNGVTPEAVIQSLISSLDKCASEGRRPSLTYIIQELLNYFMLKERQYYTETTSSSCNGFYSILNPSGSGHRQFVEVKLSAYAGRKSL